MQEFGRRIARSDSSSTDTNSVAVGHRSSGDASPTSPLLTDNSSNTNNRIITIMPSSLYRNTTTQTAATAATISRTMANPSVAYNLHARRSFFTRLHRCTSENRNVICMGLFALGLTFTSVLVSIIIILSIQNQQEDRRILPPSGLIAPIISSQLMARDYSLKNFATNKPATSVDVTQISHENDLNDDLRDEKLFIAEPRNNDVVNATNKQDKFVRINLKLLQQLVNDDKLRTEGLSSLRNSTAARRRRNIDEKLALSKKLLARLLNEFDEEFDSQLLIVNRSHVFEIMHRMWANEEFNAFHRSDNKDNNNNNNKDNEPTYTPTLNIFWAFDATSTPQNINYYAVKEKSSRTQIGLEFVDITKKISRYQRTLLIRRAIRDAMTEWSIALNRLIVFHEIPFTRETMHQRVVLIAFRSPSHRDERTKETDRFDADRTKTIAHATFNLLHLNNAFRYQLIPRPITVSVPFVLPYAPDKPTVKDTREYLYLANQRDFRYIYNRTFNDLYPYIAQPNETKSYTNLAAVLIHEIGHVLGLGHYYGVRENFPKNNDENENSASASIMLPVYNDDLTMLTALDKLAIKVLFRRLKTQNYTFPLVL